MALKNAYSKINIQQLFNSLQKILISHGARQILFEYDNAGHSIGITFIIQVKEKYIPIKLPTRIQNVKKILLDQGFRYDDEQVYRVAWRNIHDWVDSQMALIDTEMVKLEEVFLPYMTDQTGTTYFERIEKTGFLLPSGNK